MADLPLCYNTYAQITSLLQGFEQANSDIAKVHILGYSQQDHIPIYALRISRNVLLDEEEPALLFVGQVHAEEVLGVQITLANIQEILSCQEQNPYRQWIDQLDMWFIPTLNPEGHNVVTSNMDVSYRKNKRDTNLNGIFDYLPVTGYDLDGVDLNRNYSFNWVHGDSLYQEPLPGQDELYDYYRGEAPDSEAETQALKNLCDARKFVYAICWHSSRSGDFAEKVYYSFNWNDQRPSPDMAFAATIASGVGNLIIKESGSGHYDVLPHKSRKGAFHDWMYQQYGTIALLIECGTLNLQPPEGVMLGTIQRCSNGVRWLLNRALRYSSGIIPVSMLTGQVKESGTNLPLEAEVIITEHTAPWFKPRLSNPQTGRYFRPLASLNYTVTCKKKGYFDTLLPSVNVLNYVRTNCDIFMQPKAASVLHSAVYSGQTPISARVIIGSYEPDTLYVNGDFVFNGYEGEYPIQVWADGYYPYIGTVNLVAGQNNFSYNLSPTSVIFSETWETGTANWEIEGPWVRQNELSVSGYALTDSWGGTGLYDMNCNVWIKTLSPIALPAGSDIYLAFDSHLYTEWDYDIARIEVSTDGIAWQEIWQKSGRWDSWRKEFVSLTTYGGQSLYFRFRLSDVSSDVDLTDPGWTLDNIAIISGLATPVNDSVNGVSPVNSLSFNYPNPFNPQTTISYSLSAQTHVRLNIYNLKGQLVRSLVDATEQKGNHQVVWNGTDDKNLAVGSGIYLYKLDAPGYTRVLKMMLMK